MSYTIGKFFEKIHLSTYKADYGLLSKKNFNSIRLINQAYRLCSEALIEYFDGSKDTCYVRKIRTENGQYYFLLSTEEGVKEIQANTVKNVTLLNKRDLVNNINEGVIFELSGRLAERYQLRGNERIVKYKKNGSIVVLNEYEDSSVLIQRLLRYDSSCKVIGPDHFIKQYKDTVRTALVNYGINLEKHSKKFIEDEFKKQLEKEKKKKERKEKAKQERALKRELKQKLKEGKKEE